MESMSRATWLVAEPEVNKSSPTIDLGFSSDVNDHLHKKAAQKYWPEWKSLASIVNLLNNYSF